MFKPKKKLKLMILGVVFSLFIGNLTVLAAEKEYPMNHAYCKESIELYYTGYLQFQPKYYSTVTIYDIPAYKHVKRGYINFTRNNQSVIGGRLYTEQASDITSSKIYKIEKKVFDSLNPWAPKTMFYYGWELF